MVMGDTVLLEDQVNPVMSVALRQRARSDRPPQSFSSGTRPRSCSCTSAGWATRSNSRPRSARCSPRSRIRAAATLKTPKADIDPAKTKLDPEKIEAVLGVKGELKDGVYKVVVGRTTRMGAHESR